MKKLMNRFNLLLVLLIVLVISFIVLSNTGLIQIKTNKTAEVSLIQDKIVELSEWTTLRYDYSNVIVSRTERSVNVLGTDINYAETIKLIEYSGYLKAGTDLSNVQVTYNDISKQLFVRVPKSKILDNVVNTESTKVEDIVGNIFSDYPSQIIFDEINANKKQLEEEKIAQGFLDQADIRIEQILITFLKTYEFEDVVIEFY